jgi:hypothetical protein
MRLGKETRGIGFRGKSAGSTLAPSSEPWGSAQGRGAATIVVVVVVTMEDSGGEEGRWGWEWTAVGSYPNRAGSRQ